MGSFTDYLEKKVLNALFGNDTIPSLTTYFALFTAAPSDASGGTEVAATSNYARVNFSTMSSATADSRNSTTITFATCTGAGGAWGTVSHFAVFDSLSAGNMLMWATLTASKAVATSDVAQFASGSLTVSLD